MGTDTSDDDGDTVMTMPTNTSSTRKKEMTTRKMKKKETMTRKMKKRVMKVAKVLKKSISKYIPSGLITVPALKGLVRVEKEKEARLTKAKQVEREVASKRVTIKKKDQLTKRKSRPVSSKTIPIPGDNRSKRRKVQKEGKVSTTVAVV